MLEKQSYDSIKSELSQRTNFSPEEIERLHKRFVKLDKDGSGGIDKDEFMNIPNIASNPLVNRLLAIFDEDKGGTIDFKEFITGLSVFNSTDDPERKWKFIFSIYDMDNDGFISNGELFMVLKMMVGTNLNDVQLQQIVDKSIIHLDKDNDGKLSFDEFVSGFGSDDLTAKMVLHGV